MLSKSVLIMTLITLNSFAMTTTDTIGVNCRTKLIPKMDLLLVIKNYKTEWVEQSAVTKYSECIKKAEDSLAKANIVKDAETLEEVFDQIWASWSNPEYFRAVKVEFKDENGKVLKNILTYKKKP